ncbi:hypothetical protein ACIQPQ_34810 [Streptomyces sp. NPDC091281]|uniref:hypothetical protein n=1 Tax=Streptomyces sp. NPDC091281 TaxID=3365985 RepID=UPI00381236C2
MSSAATGPEVGAIPPDALTLLVLPERVTLDAVRQRGAACVWCSAPLTVESSVDLGEQHDGPQAWFPRACRRDTAARAHTALFDHVGTCAQCTDDRDLCGTSKALYRLIRQEWR